MSSNYPFHRVGANLPGYKKPTMFITASYYGCDPYNTVDAAAVRQKVVKVMRLVSPPPRTWTQARYMK